MRDYLHERLVWDEGVLLVRMHSSPHPALSPGERENPLGRFIGGNAPAGDTVLS